MNKKILIAFSLVAALAAACFAGCKPADHDHDFANWKVTREATCTKEGKRERKCTICGYVEREDIATIPHDFDKKNVCKVCATPLKWSEGIALRASQDGESYTVAGIGIEESADIVLPAYYEEKPVTAIDDNAFTGERKVRSVQLQSQIVSIGANAFNGCTALTDFYAPDSVKEIGMNAFTNCTALRSVRLGTGVKEIRQLFVDCERLSEVKIDGKVTVIEAYSFSGCAALRGIDIPDSVTEIGPAAFSGCASFTSIAIPKKVVRLEPRIFKDCSNLERVTLRGVIEFLGQETFDECILLEKIVFPGKMSDWKNIVKEQNWIGGHTTGDFTVNCTDGDLSWDNSEYMDYTH